MSHLAMNSGPIMRAALIVAASATLAMGLEEPQSVAYATAQVRIKLATSQARLAWATASTCGV